MPARPILYLVDGSSQMYRAFHAPIRGNDGTILHNARGLPTNAVYIFVTMLRKLLKEHSPELIAASFDLPGRTFRDDLAADYKANRAPMPDDLAAQIPLVHRACEALGVPIITQERYEADDVIGTLTLRAVSQGYDVAIVTGDKDFFQLVGDHVRVFNPRDDGTWYDAAGVKEKFGVTPEQVVDTLSLMGDTIDNVKGVPGIGEKGARDLISMYGTLDNLIAHAPELKKKNYREALQEHAGEARASRELLRIHTDVPVEFEIPALRYRGPSRDECYALFSELEFRSLVMEFAPTADTIQKDYQAVTTSSSLRTLVDHLRSTGRFALRTIADGAPMQGRIVGFAFSTEARWARYVSVGIRAPSPAPTPSGTGSLGFNFDEPEPASTDRADSALGLDEVLAALKPVLEDPSIEKAGHDLKFDLIVLARHGVGLQGLGLDTMLASYLLDATRSSGHGLESLAIEHLGYKALTEEDVCGKGVKAVPLSQVAPDLLLKFSGERADLAWQLAGTLGPMLDARGLQPVYADMERPLIPVLAAMERAGVRIDAPALAAQSVRVESELAEKSATIYALAGESFNINSPKQLSEILFDRLSLPPSKRNNRSTAVDVLEDLALTHELPQVILDWRRLQKLKGTYIDALPLLVNPETGRIHTSFNQAVAATGRLSSSDPNLQNIPIKTELGREIRRAFVADPGCVLISADYSQIELRVLAHLADEDTLIRAFQAGEDIHDQTALKIFGAESGRDRHELRRLAKMVNYALLYGKTAFTLSKDIGVTPQAAQTFIDAYFAGFPKVRAYIDRTLEEGRASGVVKTLYGRRRLVPDLNSRNQQIRSEAERAAVNMPIQGTAADIMKRAMIDVHAALEGSDARMILTVHDELVFEVPETDAEAVAKVVQDRMQSAATLKIPLTVDVGIGKNWKDAK